jgi:hypothetical protein
MMPRLPTKLSVPLGLGGVEIQKMEFNLDPVYGAEAERLAKKLFAFYEEKGPILKKYLRKPVTNGPITLASIEDIVYLGIDCFRNEYASSFKWLNSIFPHRIKYIVDLSFTDNANNEFWVNIERCTGSGCTDFTKVGQTLGENSNGFTDKSVSNGSTYSYRVRAHGFMGDSEPSNTIEISVGSGSPPSAPGNLAAEMSNAESRADQGERTTDLNGKERMKRIRIIRWPFLVSLVFFPSAALEGQIIPWPRIIKIGRPGPSPSCRS